MITIDGKQIKLQIWDTVTELLNIYTLFIQQECKKKISHTKFTKYLKV